VSILLQISSPEASDLLLVVFWPTGVYPAANQLSNRPTCTRCIQIKLKNVNKKRMATARRLIFLEFIKASIADLITLFFSLLQNSEGSGDSDSGDSFADPLPIFTITEDQNLTFSLSPSLLRPFAKN
jgi:hypothetical protein